MKKHQQPWHLGLETWKHKLWSENLDVEQTNRYQETEGRKNIRFEMRPANKKASTSLAPGSGDQET